MAVKAGTLFSIFTKGIEATGLETLEHSMKSIAFLTAAAAAIAGGILYIASASEQTDGDSSPIYGVKIPAGYRDWRLISVKQLAGTKVKQLRAQLGSGLIDQSQKMTAAAMQMADMKVCEHRS